MVYGLIILPHLATILVHKLDVEQNALMTAKYKKEGFNVRPSHRQVSLLLRRTQDRHRLQNYSFYFINTDQCEKIWRRHMPCREKENLFLWLVLNGLS